MQKEPFFRVQVQYILYHMYIYIEKSLDFFVYIMLF